MSDITDRYLMERRRMAFPDECADVELVLVALKLDDSLNKTDTLQDEP